MVDLATSLSRDPHQQGQARDYHPQPGFAALMTTRIRLVILLAVCITAAGLLVPQPTRAAAPRGRPAAAAALLDPSA